MRRKDPLGYELVGEDVSGTSCRKSGKIDGVERNMVSEAFTVDDEVEVAAGGEGEGSKVVAGD